MNKNMGDKMGLVIFCEICEKPLEKTHWNTKYHPGKCSMEAERRRATKNYKEKKTVPGFVTNDILQKIVKETFDLIEKLEKRIAQLEKVNNIEVNYE